MSGNSGEPQAAKRPINLSMRGPSEKGKGMYDRVCVNIDIVEQAASGSTVNMEMFLPMMSHRRMSMVTSAASANFYKDVGLLIAEVQMNYTLGTPAYKEALELGIEKILRERGWMPNPMNLEEKKAKIETFTRDLIYHAMMTKWLKEDLQVLQRDVIAATGKPWYGKKAEESDDKSDEEIDKSEDEEETLTPTNPVSLRDSSSSLSSASSLYAFNRETSRTLSSECDSNSDSDTASLSSTKEKIVEKIEKPKPKAKPKAKPKGPKRMTLTAAMRKNVKEGAGKKIN